MDWQDYMDDVREDAKNSINENIAYYDDFQSLYDNMFNDDSVTGNGSGSYYFNSYKAAEAISGIIFDKDAVNEFKTYGYDGIPTEEGPEPCDVIARCICLGLLSGELEQYYNKLKGEDEDE